MIQDSVKNFPPRLPTFLEVQPFKSLEAPNTNAARTFTDDSIFHKLTGIEAILEKESWPGLDSYISKNMVVRGDFS